jgi:5'-nucleotidase
MEKLTIYIDMDGVLANFEKAADQLSKNLPENISEKVNMDEVLNFSHFEPMPNAIESVKKIIEMGHDVFIASTPPWNNPSAWGQKRDWIEEHLPELKRKVFLTHRKDMLIGDVLIDDTTYRGQKDFNGTFIHFGQHGMDWPTVVGTIETMTNILKITKK